MRKFVWFNIGVLVFLFCQTAFGVTISSTLDTTAPPSGAGYTATTGTQTGRINRFSPISSCGTNKTNPGLNSATGARQYDAYVFTAATTGCINVTLTSPNAGNLYTVAYNNAGFVPANPSTNFLADPSSSSNPQTFAFNVTAGEQFTVVVHEVTAAGGAAQNYTLDVNYAPTAAGATAGGRVTEEGGRGIYRTLITMTNSLGNQRVAYTNQLGYYNFTDVAGGQVYVFTAQHRRYVFDQPNQVQFIGEETDGINFIGTTNGFFRYNPWNLPTKAIQ